jgi:hypothetical protein
MADKELGPATGLQGVTSGARKVCGVDLSPRDLVELQSVIRRLAQVRVAVALGALGALIASCVLMRQLDGAMQALPPGTASLQLLSVQHDAAAFLIASAVLVGLSSVSLAFAAFFTRDFNHRISPLNFRVVRWSVGLDGALLLTALAAFSAGLGSGLTRQLPAQLVPSTSSLPAAGAALGLTVACFGLLGLTLLVSAVINNHEHLVADEARNNRRVAEPLH